MLEKLPQNASKYVYTHTFDINSSASILHKRKTNKKKRQSPTLSEKEKPGEILYAKKKRYHR